MSLEKAALLWRAVLCIHIPLIVGERHLRVDHHMAVVGKVEDKVGHQSLPVIALHPLAAAIAQGLLGVKLLSFTQFQVLKQLT